jgi:hypothetical protein
MACIDMVKTSKEDMLFYNLDAAVGPGCQNNIGDVLLVQYLLDEAFNDTARFPDAPDSPDFTGVADTDTITAISYYQKKLRSQGKSISTDGRVDPAPNHQSHGSISGTQYTIIWLNLEYQKRRPADYKTMAKASDCPAGLVEEVTPNFLHL